MNFVLKLTKSALQAGYWIPSPLATFALTGTIIFCIFSYTYVTDYFEGKLTTFYHQIPRAEAEKLKILPKFAVCVPYNGTYFSMVELSDSRFKEVKQDLIKRKKKDEKTWFYYIQLSGKPGVY